MGTVEVSAVVVEVPAARESSTPCVSFNGLDPSTLDAVASSLSPALSSLSEALASQSHPAGATFFFFFFAFAVAAGSRYRRCTQFPCSSRYNLLGLDGSFLRTMWLPSSISSLPNVPLTPQPTEPIAQPRSTFFFFFFLPDHLPGLPG